MKSKKKRKNSYRLSARASIARVKAILKYDLDAPNDLTPFERALLEAERGVGVKVKSHEELVEKIIYSENDKNKNED